MRFLIRIAVLAALVALSASGLVLAGSVRLRPLPPIQVDGEGSPIRGPQGVGCGRNSALVVADTGNGRLLLYEIAEEVIRPAGVISGPQIPVPIHAEIASSGEILALDGKSRKIARFAAQGEFRGYVEPREGMVPRGFELDRDGNLYVLDIFSARILVVDPAGALKREIAFPEDHGVFSDLAVDAAGTVFVIDSARRTMFTAGKDASALSPVVKDLEGKADFPTGIATDGTGNVYVCDQNGGSILVLGPDGSFRARQSGLGWKAGLLRYPSSVCVDESDHLFVADRANNRIQIFAIVR